MCLGWEVFYELLAKYKGNIDMATLEERGAADIACSNDPSKALLLAQERYKITWGFESANID